MREEATNHQRLSSPHEHRLQLLLKRPQPRLLGAHRLFGSVHGASCCRGVFESLACITESPIPGDGEPHSAERVSRGAFLPDGGADASQFLEMFFGFFLFSRLFFLRLPTLLRLVLLSEGFQLAPLFFSLFHLANEHGVCFRRLRDRPGLQHAAFYRICRRLLLLLLRLLWNGSRGSGLPRQLSGLAVGLPQVLCRASWSFRLALLLLLLDRLWSPWALLDLLGLPG